MNTPEEFPAMDPSAVCPVAHREVEYVAEMFGRQVRARHDVDVAPHIFKRSHPLVGMRLLLCFMTTILGSPKVEAAGEKQTRIEDMVLPYGGIWHGSFGGHTLNESGMIPRSISN